MNTATSAPVLCKRCRVGDYVMGEDSEGDHAVGRISKVSGDLVTVIDRLGSGHEFLRYQTYKSTKAAYDAFAPAGNPEDDSFPPVEVMPGNGLDTTSGLTEGTSLASENPSPADATPDSAPATKATGPIRLHPNFARYVKHSDKTATGRPCLDIDDRVATALRGLNIDDCYRQTSRYLVALGVAPTDKRPVTMSGLRAKYGHLNPGMQRMNLGNVLRGVLRSLGVDLPEVAFGEDPENPDE